MARERNEVDIVDMKQKDVPGSSILRVLIPQFYYRGFT